MTDSKLYLLISKCRQSRLWIIGACTLLLVGIYTPSQSQVHNQFLFEEVLVGMHAPRIGQREIPAIIQGQDIYLSISDVFNYLEIQNTSSQNLDSVHGFFIHPLSKYVIDRVNNNIVYEGSVYNLKPNNLLRTETGLYLKANYFNEVFGLDFQFSFRNLTVTLSTKVELPAIRRMQQEVMRQNIKLLKREIKADTTVGRTRRIFNGGMADWAIISNQESQGKGNTRLNLNLGAYVGGGEANVSLVHNTNAGFDRKQQYYRWRLVNNKSSLIRQVSVGRIHTQAISSIFGPTTGVQITNTPTTFRKSFGSYRLTNMTEPDWTVELYVNNILIDYTKADASGFFSFDVPLVYGNTIVKLRSFGPYGEERVREEQINIPFNFLPQNEFEYTLSAGLVDDKTSSKFTRANFNYGFTRRITVGAGVEYLSNVMPSKVMPFVTASWRLGSRILFSGEHTYGVRTKAFLSYQLPSKIQLELNYINYTKGQTAILNNYSEERKAALSYIFRAKRFSGFTKLTLNQIILPKGKLTNGELVISGFFAGISSNLTTTAIIQNESNPLLFSNLSLTFKLPAGVRVTPQARYDFNNSKLNFLKLEVEKRVMRKGFANLSYQYFVGGLGGMYTMGLRYNFSFAQVGVSLRHSKNGTSTFQNASGSIMWDDKEKKTLTNYLGNVGRGAITIVPFIDINNNGKRDKDEPKAFGLKLHIRGGKIERNRKDTTIRITGLEAHNDYLIELNKASFDNISWRILKPNIQVTVEPNHFKLIEVPVTVMGEVSGTVLLDKKQNGGKAGIGRMYVNIYKNDTTLVAKTLTEPDGYFSYLGLSPGKYTASIDTVQMAKLNFCCNETHGFNINVSFDGDIVDGIDFNITSWDTIPPPKIEYVPQPEIVDTVVVEKPKKKEPSYLVVGFIPAKTKAVGQQTQIQKAVGNNRSINKAGKVQNNSNQNKKSTVTARMNADGNRLKSADNSLRSSYSKVNSDNAALHSKRKEEDKNALQVTGKEKAMLTKKESILRARAKAGVNKMSGVQTKQSQQKETIVKRPVNPQQKVEFPRKKSINIQSETKNDVPGVSNKKNVNKSTVNEGAGKGTSTLKSLKNKKTLNSSRDENLLRSENALVHPVKPQVVPASRKKRQFTQAKTALQKMSSIKSVNQHTKSEEVFSPLPLTKADENVLNTQQEKNRLMKQSPNKKQGVNQQRKPPSDLPLRDIKPRQLKEDLHRNGKVAVDKIEKVKLLFFQL